MMKREIKFRGVRFGSNYWVYGSLCLTYEDEPESIYIIDKECTYIRIKPETVGQFTGATNKNGVEIYEGDFDADGNCVSWCPACNGWEFSNIDIPTEDTFIPCHRCCGEFSFEDHLDEFEVIGNKQS